MTHSTSWYGYSIGKTLSVRQLPGRRMSPEPGVKFLRATVFFAECQGVGRTVLNTLTVVVVLLLQQGYTAMFDQGDAFVGGDVFTSRMVLIQG